MLPLLPVLPWLPSCQLLVVLQTLFSIISPQKQKPVLSDRVPPRHVRRMRRLALRAGSSRATPLLSGAAQGSSSLREHCENQAYHWLLPLTYKAGRCRCPQGESAFRCLSSFTGSACGCPVMSTADTRLLPHKKASSVDDAGQHLYSCLSSPATDVLDTVQPPRSSSLLCWAPRARGAWAGAEKEPPSSANCTDARLEAHKGCTQQRREGAPARPPTRSQDSCRPWVLPLCEPREHVVEHPREPAAAWNAGTFSLTPLKRGCERHAVLLPPLR